MSNKIKLTCDEATMICNKNQYGEATLAEKIRLNIHFLKCRICKKYTQQNALITKILAMGKNGRNGGACLTEEEKEHLKEKIKDKVQV